MKNKIDIMCDILKLTGQTELKDTFIMGIKYKDLIDIEMNYVYKIIYAQLESKEKSLLYDDLVLIYGKEYIDQTVINGIKVEELNGEALGLLYELFLCVSIRYKERIEVVEHLWVLGDEGQIKLVFDYHPDTVEKMKCLQTSQFHSKVMKDENNKIIKIESGKNKGKPKKEVWWTVHISELQQLKKIFKITQIDCELAYIEWRNQNAVNKLIIDNQCGHLYGFNLPMYELDQATSYHIKGVEFSKNFHEGYTDGRDHLYELGTRKFPRGLYSKMKSLLEKHNVIYKEEDNRTEPVKKYDWEYKGKYEPRDYQIDGYQRIVQHRTGIEQLATGAGKTILAGYTTSQIGVDTIFFVHTKFLLKQAKDAFTDALKMEIGQIGDGIVNIQPVTVAMVQTVIRAYGEEYDESLDNEDEDITDNTDITGHEEEIKELIEKKVDLVFFDECQFVGAETFYKIANRCNSIYKIGLSATPYRSDGKDMKIKAALGEVIHRITASYLIERGVLVQPMIKFIKIASTNRDNNQKSTYQQIYKDSVVENINRNQIVVNEAIKLVNRGKSVLLLVQQIKHGELLQKMFQEKGYEVEFTCGKKDPSAERRNAKVSKLFRKEKYILIASTIADEGLDIQTLDSIILCGGGKSPSKAMQRLGRGLRKIDFVGLAKMFAAEDKNILVIADTQDKKKEFLQNCKDRGVKAISSNTNEQLNEIEQTKGNIVVCLHTDMLKYKAAQLDVICSLKKGDLWEDIVKTFADVPYKFVDKDYAYIVDFIDCEKYLYGHSVERARMYMTEPKFQVYGWQKK